jgi:hypothetical protein
MAVFVVFLLKDGELELLALVRVDEMSTKLQQEVGAFVLWTPQCMHSCALRSPLLSSHP